MKVKSTYNFVPAPKNQDVFLPDWAHMVSHDIPFSDGESGEIQIDLKAETPVYIRNGHTKKDSECFQNYLKKKAENSEYKTSPAEEESIERYLSFSNINGKFFIPASSLKGMFRNVLEIMTKSRLNKSLVNNNRYSFRDLTRDSFYMNSYNSRQVRAGWLREQEDGNWIIEECKEVYHIHHEEVDKALKTNFRKLFLNQNPKDKSAAYKYKNCQASKEISFVVREDDNGKKKAVFDSPGNLKGTIVFTGQPGSRKEGGGRPSGKVHEFVFEDSNKPVLIKISPQQKDDFKFIYLDHDKNNISPDWKFWRSKLEKGERVPVFFNKDGETSVKHFGLSYMYKLPYNHSVHEMYPLNSYSDEIDLAELIFGKIGTESSLKGRLMIGHAFSVSTEPAQMEKKKDILGSPKASYFPFYISQDKPKEYKTYQNKNEIRGFKRYPVRSRLLEMKYSEKQNDNPNVFSHFVPLKEGTGFSLKIRFHNLRKIEIGALLSAITFHDNTEHCFHSLGFAKSFGYGKLKVNQVKTNFLRYSKQEYLLAFEEKMGIDWFDSAAVRELFAMASNQNEENLTFPSLEPNEFIQYKKEHEWLHPFSEINRRKFTSVLARYKKEKDKLEQEKDHAEREMRLAREMELSVQLRHSDDRNALEDFIGQYPSNENVSIFRARIEELRRIEKQKDAQAMASKPIEGLSDRFDVNKSILNEYIRKNKHFVFSEAQQQQIIQSLRDCFKSNPESFYKKKKPAKFTEFPWTDIVKWLGMDKSRDLYNEFN
jgi:CRISPR-associated protein (TIGR03986 family)